MEAGDWLWVWIAAAVAFAFLELVTPFMFFMISFAAGAALAALAALLDVGVGAQWAVFLVASIAALLVMIPLGRRIARAQPDGDETPEGASRWVGRVAVVLEEIPGGTNETGLVRLERSKWRAETADDAPIPIGTEVDVISVRGTRLIVAPPEPASPDPARRVP